MYSTFDKLGSDNKDKNSMKNTSSSSVVKEIKTYEEKLSGLSSSIFVVVDNYAEWCGPCKDLEPKYNDLALSYSQNKSMYISFYKENVDDVLPNIKNAPPVTSIPRVDMYQNGKYIDSVYGSDIESINNMITKNMSSYLRR